LPFQRLLAGGPVLVSVFILAQKFNPIAAGVALSCRVCPTSERAA
jgi:hypothetical protein